VLQELGHIPVEGESVELKVFDPDVDADNPIRWRATVARMDGRRIDLVDLVKLGQRGASDG
jgi:CBS domain containing-hemolysin-like protein